jgi:hypothetical protein
MIAGSVIWLLATRKRINNFSISEVPKRSLSLHPYLLLNSFRLYTLSNKIFSPLGNDTTKTEYKGMS